jgi:release factor glutamine methyltransferase
MLISAGKLRRLTHPIFLRYWLKRTANRTVTTQVDGFTLRVFPTVFHPRYFGSSAILGRYVESQDLKGRTFLDMGAGSGIIGLFAARAGANVTGVDINPSAVQCASENALAAGFQIEYCQSDLFSALHDRRFDVVAWNPPFFPTPARTTAEAALHAGEGYAAIARFARSCRQHLNLQGRIILVVTLDIDIRAVQSMFEEQGFSVRRVLARKWGLAETMVVLEAE